jgi:uncharacterized protein YodC (DUF2158 family)
MIKLDWKTGECLPFLAGGLDLGVLIAPFTASVYSITSFPRAEGLRSRVDLRAGCIVAPAGGVSVSGPVSCRWMKEEREEAGSFEGKSLCAAEG